MIDFELSPEHQAVEKMVRDWAAKEVAPKIHDLDREHRFERKFLKDMADLQLLGICIPEELGGAGMRWPTMITSPSALPTDVVGTLTETGPLGRYSRIAGEAGP